MTKQIDFKSAIKELEEINRWFQSDEIDLDEGLKRLQRAKELIAMCKGRLAEVENEFSTLKQEIVSTGESPEKEVPYIAASDKVIADELPF